MSIEHSPVRNTRGAAVYVGLSASTLNKLRITGDGPTFIKLGRKVVYRLEDLDNYLTTHRRTRTLGGE